MPRRRSSAPRSRRRQGAREIQASEAARDSDCVRLTATFESGPFFWPGSILDRAEFVLKDGTAAFRSASSSAGWPFSTSDFKVKREIAPRSRRDRAEI